MVADAFDEYLDSCEFDELIDPEKNRRHLSAKLSKEPGEKSRFFFCSGHIGYGKHLAQPGSWQHTAYAFPLPPPPPFHAFFMGDYPFITVRNINGIKFQPLGGMHGQNIYPVPILLILFRLLQFSFTDKDMVFKLLQTAEFFICCCIHSASFKSAPLSFPSSASCFLRYPS